MSSEEVKEPKSPAFEPIVIGCGLLLAAAFVWTYTFADKESLSSLNYLWYAWWSPDYQYGFFVLPFCAFLLWSRRGMMTEIPARGSWWGLALFAVWAAVRLGGAFSHYPWLQHASIIPGVAAITLFVGGWRALLWAWPAILFMGFMIPLPGFLTDFLSQPLQKIGSVCTVFVIQTLGIPATRLDNQIQLSDMPNALNVAEVCSGIRMLMLFFALCVGAAFIMKNREPSDGLQDSIGSIPVVGPFFALLIANWERWLMVVSAIPIAVVANVVRLTLIALFSELVSQYPTYLLSAKAAENWPSNVTETWAHDVPGLLMMPVGMILLWIEWLLLSKLFLDEPTDRAVAVRGTTRTLLPMAAAPQAGKRP